MIEATRSSDAGMSGALTERYANGRAAAVTIFVTSRNRFVPQLDACLTRCHIAAEQNEHGTGFVKILAGL